MPDAGEEQFAASLEAPARQPDTPRNDGEAELWRQEVASRVDAFCARRGRKRAPRLPSLSLNFEPVSRGSTACQTADPWESVDRAPAIAEPPRAALELPTEPSNVIVFPKPAAPPPPPLPPPLQLPFVEELAEPIIETPRILEADPEDIGLQFGGSAMPSISLECPPPAPAAEKFPEPAGLSQRGFAAVVDAGAVLLASAVFALVFARLAGAPAMSRGLAAAGIAVPALLWGIYEYVFLVYAGRTLGTALAGLELRTFDGLEARQRTRRWRALAMIVSAMSLGMGFLWAAIDEDGLCWHDRISHTLLQPRA